MTAYYNEFDPGAAAWLRELIEQGAIAPGYVDERSILDVQPDDLTGYTQCHFFAGIGGWSYALRLAGWPDDRPVWTGSPPCQPFSPAGKGLSKDDPRHLAPHFVQLVRACKPPVLFGEQVASADVFGRVAKAAKRAAGDAPEWAWFDDLSDRLEAARYAVGAGDIPAAGIGAPHIRQRCFFGAVRMADADDAGSQGRGERGDGADQRAAGAAGVAGRLADGHGGLARNGPIQCSRQHRCEPQDGEAGGLVDGADPAGADATDGVWRDPDWLLCRDDRWRPVEPGTFPLADGLPARVGRLRGYGNAIVPQAGAAFIKAFCAAAGL